MRTNCCIVLVVFLATVSHYFAQTPACPSPYAYLDGSTFIRYYDPAQPVSGSNPANTNIPTFGSGLTLMPNINGGTLSPTFYSTSGGTYWYWNGVTWVNTGHGTGNGSAVNIAGCGTTIYNLVGSTGQVYAYNGTGTGSLLTTITNFNGGGPYDLQTDCNCNFYALNTTSPNQNLTMYSPTGVPLCTYSLSNFPNSSAGGGFAIVGNYVYVRNNVASPGGFYVGLISGGSVTFTTLTNFSPGPGDMAACPVCVPSGSLTNAFMNGGVLGCTSATTNLTAYATGTNLLYNWTGPGIVSGNSTSVITVSQVGNYTCVVSTGGCPPTQITLTTTVFNNSVTVPVSILPAGNICLNPGNTLQLVALHTYTNDIVNWQGPNMISNNANDTLLINGPGIYTVQIVDPYTACVGAATVAVAVTPTVSLASSDFSLCVYNTANSPNSITITPSGASNYTLFTSSNFMSTSANGTIMPCYVNTANGATGTIATATLVGSVGFCTDTAYASFQIVPNPTITVPVGAFSICPGGSQQLTVGGAASYTWSGGQGLSAFSGPTVMSTPLTTEVYTVFSSDAGCNSASQTLTLTVMPLPTLNISPTTTNICAGGTVALIASSNANMITWYPSVGLTSSMSPVPIASPPASQVYTVVADLNGCLSTGTTFVQVTNPPIINLSLGTASICAYAMGGSPIATTATASGAAAYTLSSSGYVNVNPPNGPLFNLTAGGIQLQTANVVTLTLDATSTVCRVSTTATLLVVPNPTITITPPTANICPGKTQTYVATGAQNYTWSPGNYTLNASNSIVAGALYTSYYSVFGSSNGCFSDQKSSVLLINPVPTVGISQSMYTVCAGNSVFMTAFGNGTAFTWSPSVGLQNPYSAIVAASPPASQSYTVLTSLNGCTNTAYTTLSVIVNPIISAAAVDQTICIGKSTNLVASGANSYNWIPGSSLNFTTGNVVVASPKQNTTYTLQGFNGVCNGSTTIDVVTLDVPQLQITGSKPELCLGERMFLTATGAQKYTWQPTNTLFMSPGDSIAQAAPQVNTNYSITGVNQLGSVTCVSQMQYSVIVRNYVIPVVSDSVEICPGEKTRLVCTGGTTYTWTPNFGLLSSSGPTVVASPTASTIYNVNASYNGACGGNATVMVSVKPGPTVTASADTSYNLSQVMIIRAMSNGSVNWVQGEAIECTDCNETRIYASHDGCYVVQAQNETGCLAYDEVCIEVTEDFSIYLPNTFTPNNDGINDIFAVYGENISEVKLAVYDRWGAKVFYSEDVLKGWDGSYKGETCKNDIYTWVLSYKGLDRKTYHRTGHVSLFAEEK